MRYIFLNGKNLLNVMSDIDFWKTYSGLADGTIDYVRATPPAQGSGYSAEDVLTVVGGDSNGTVKVKTVDGSGKVTAYYTQPSALGAGYRSGTCATTTVGGGDGNATVYIEANAGRTCDEHATAALRAEGFNGSLLQMVSEWIKSSVTLS